MLTLKMQLGLKITKQDLDLEKLGKMQDLKLILVKHQTSYLFFITFQIILFVAFKSQRKSS